MRADKCRKAIRTKSYPAETPKGPLPLVLAVTGHRDLCRADEEPLRRCVKEIFHELTQSYPSTPLQVLSGLAEGADRLVAHVALQIGAQLVACLPMEQALYEEDFQTTESRREFQQLLDAAAEVIVLPLANSSSRESVLSHGPHRDKQYEALGEFIVDQSQILIALWNGESTNLVGGTSCVVQLQLGERSPGGGAKPCSLLDFPETGPVYQIVTPRSTNTAINGQPYSRRDRYHAGFESEEEARKTYERIFGRLNLFNHDAIAHASELETARSQSKERLIPAATRSKLPNELQRLIDNYGWADALAIHFQQRTKKSMKRLIFLYGLFGLLLFALFAHGPSAFQAPALFLYLLVVVLAFKHYEFARSHELKTRHLDYRALAEGLRLQIFWKLSAIDHAVADHYLRKQRTELEWIRHAIRAWSLAARKLVLVPDLQLIQTHWVEDQREFFQRAACRHAGYHRRELGWTWGPIYGLLAIATAVAGLIVMNWLTGAAHFPYLANEDGAASTSMYFGLHGSAVILMTMLPGIAGAVAAYSLKMAFNEQRKQYARMKSLYQRASSCLTAATRNRDEALAKSIITDLGIEALEENADWVLLHRERSFEIRLAG